MPRTLLGTRTLILVAATAALTLSLHAQQTRQPAGRGPDRQTPPVTFRVEINYVEVDAVVLDRAGQFVDDLQAGEFQLLEDGRPQKVSSFGIVEIPVERPEAPLFVPRPIEPDVQTNARPLEGRVYMIVLDELHTNATDTARIRAAARRFVETSIGANDVAAVVSVQGRATQEFTSNKRLLLAAIDRFIGRSIESVTQSRIQDYYNQRAMNSGSGPVDMYEMQRAYNAKVTLGVVRRLADFMNGVRGRRKAMVLFTDGIDYNITDVLSNRSAADIIQDTRDAIGAATRANVVLYTVDPRGLAALPGLDASSLGPPVDASPLLNLGAAGAAEDLRTEQDSLRTLAEETGGFAAINSNDFASAFDRIQQENSRYYVLGYYPESDRRDGRFRRIEVRVTRPGVTVRARKGYLEPRGKPAAEKPLEVKPGTPPELREVMGSPLPVAGLRLTVTAAPFKGKAPNASVRVVVQADGRDLVFRPKDGKYEDTLDLAMVAFDSKSGDSKGGQHHKLTMPLLPASYERVARSGLRVTTRLDVPPGRYQLRVAATESEGRHTGSVYYDLEVPDFSDGPLTMSGLLITSSLAGEVPTAPGTEDDLRTALPGPPTVSRTFRSQEELAVLAEVYDNDKKTPHRVDIKTSLLADDGRELFRHEDQRDSRELGAAGGGYGYTAKVPLKGLAPGLYVLRVEARSRLGKDTSASREVQIRVQ